MKYIIIDNSGTGYNIGDIVVGIIEKNAYGYTCMKRTTDNLLQFVYKHQMKRISPLNNKIKIL